MKHDNDLYTIGDLGRHEDISTQTLRYYEKRGLIESTSRSQGNYRLYDEAARNRLRFIRRAQKLGFTLNEIAELLDLERHSEQDMGVVKAIAERKMAEIDARIADLERIKRGLLALTQTCPGHGSRADCPVLSALSGKGENHG